MTDIQESAPARSEVAVDMQIDWDIELVMDDGVVLRGDLFRPVGDGPFPVIASYGVYGKNLNFQEDPYTPLWQQMAERYPDTASGSSNTYANFEVVDPEKWVPYGYAVLRVDSRGAGRSPGVMDLFSDTEARDFYTCIEWAGTQPWSNGKVGLTGISYYAVNQWHVAGLQPPHLAAICPWEGWTDYYRDMTHHGGIHSGFLTHYLPVQVWPLQNGLGTRGPKSSYAGPEQVTGDVDLSDEELDANRAPMVEEVRDRPFFDDYYERHSADLDKITVPILSAGNWGGLGLHSRGNFRGYQLAKSKDKWLEVHGGEHWTLMYTDYGTTLQRKFFDYFLKGQGDWAESQPPVVLHVRHPGEKFVIRHENEWPLERTEWTKVFLDPAAGALNWAEEADESHTAYRALTKEGLTLTLPPRDEPFEITGPIACKLFISSSTKDADLFVVLRLFDPAGEEVLFHGANDPHVPIAQGWLRASHRALDEERSEPWAPYHSHESASFLTPGEVYELDIEVWPTSIVVPAGYTLAVSVLGQDYEHDLPPVMSHVGKVMKGSAFQSHDDTRERDPEIYDNEVTVYGGGERGSYILLPVIPA
ncbi:hypothetical protein ASG90_00990 [Nocardioides sp. Soil797]|nr:hypothetical protein ASG90_00990 [Nocardioides sp. Soil797]